MTSADFSQFVVTMLRFEYVYSYTSVRPPRVSATTFTSCICCIYTLKFGQYWTLLCIGSSSVSSMPCMQFLFVRPRLCRRLPSDSASRRTPLPLANSSYCQVCSGLSPPSDCACRAHYNDNTADRIRSAVLSYVSTAILRKQTHKKHHEVGQNTRRNEEGESQSHDADG